MVDRLDNNVSIANNSNNVWAERRGKFPSDDSSLLNNGVITPTVVQQIVTGPLEKLSTQVSRMEAFGKEPEKYREVRNRIEDAKNSITQILQAGVVHNVSSGYSNIPKQSSEVEDNQYGPGV